MRSVSICAFVLAAACGVEGESDVLESERDGQARVYCDGQSCVNITPGVGYTATSTGPGVVIKRGATVVAKYDIDGSDMPAGPWVDTEWKTVDCQGVTVGVFAIGVGLDVLVLSDTAFVVIDGGPIAATITSLEEFHPEIEIKEEPPNL